MPKTRSSAKRGSEENRKLRNRRHEASKEAFDHKRVNAQDHAVFAQKVKEILQRLANSNSKQPCPFLDAVHRMYPKWQESTGNWTCGYCLGWLPKSYVGEHICKKNLVFVMDDIVLNNGRCTLCNHFAKPRSPHECTAAGWYHYDISGTYTFEQSKDWSDEPLSPARELQGIWVMVFREPKEGKRAVSQLVRHHALVARSNIENAGLGLFTLSGLEPWKGNTPRSAEGEVPVSRRTVGAYTGITLPPGTNIQDRSDSTSRLEVLTVRHMNVRFCCSSTELLLIFLYSFLFYALCSWTTG